MRERYLLPCLFMVALFCHSSMNSKAQLRVTFPSKDGVTITADWYPVDGHSPVILLCHQAGSSRGEYTESGLRLNKFGFNCLAVDLRSGDKMNDVVNETAVDAGRMKKGQSYLDAEPDILAAIDYLFEKYKRKIILCGSSYSASLALKIANENDRILGVAAFSPGEYFDQKDFVAKHIRALNKPVFLTSSKEESEAVTDLTKDVVSMIKIQYIPNAAGDHGSKVLWSSKPSNQEYWIAFMSFLNRMKKNDAQEVK